MGGGGENTHGKRYFLHRSHKTLSADTIIHCDLHWRHRRHLFVAFITRIGSVGGRVVGDIITIVCILLGDVCANTIIPY